MPTGFRYEADILSPGEERELLERFADLPFREFAFHGYLGKRRIISFGWHYDFSSEKLREADAMPEFLLPARDIPAVSILRYSITFRNLKAKGR